MPARLLMLDDHPLVFHAVATALQERRAPFELEVGLSVADGLRLTASSQPDLVLLDLSLPDAPGLEALQRLLHAHRMLRVAIFSARTEVAVMRQALEAGACGFIPKGSSMAVICSAVALMLDGGTYLPPQLVERPGVGRFGSDHRAAGQGADPFTPRQAEVLAMLIDGASNKAIARRLNLTEGTVKIHVSAVLRRLGVRTRSEAVMAAVRSGLATGVIVPAVAPASDCPVDAGAVVVRDETGWRLSDAA